MKLLREYGITRLFRYVARRRYFDARKDITRPISIAAAGQAA